jgi:flagellar protein FliO/FliZ
MMILFSPVASIPRSTLHWTLRYGLSLLAAMVVLWGGARAAAMSPSASAGQVATTDSAMVASPPASGGAPSIEVFTWGNAAALLLLMGGGAYALYLRQRGGGMQSSTLFRTMGQLALGQSQQLRLVACGGEVLLLGVTDDEVTLLKTYPRDAFEHLDGDDDAGGPIASSAGGAASVPDALTGDFSEVLDRFVQRDARS